MTVSTTWINSFMSTVRFCSSRSRPCFARWICSLCASSSARVVETLRIRILHVPLGGGWFCLMILRDIFLRDALEQVNRQRCAQIPSNSQGFFNRTVDCPLTDESLLELFGEIEDTPVFHGEGGFTDDRHELAQI